MRKIIILMLPVILFCACNGSNEKWEYKLLKYGGETMLYYQGDNNSFYPTNFDNPESALNQLGQDGWELVSTYTTVETVFPNFGNTEYVTGIRENTRTRTVNFILKRKARSSSAETTTQSASDSDVVVTEATVEEDIVE